MAQIKIDSKWLKAKAEECYAKMKVIDETNPPTLQQVSAMAREAGKIALINEIFEKENMLINIIPNN